MTLKTIEGTFIAPKGRYALVVGRFNSFVVESLVSGAVDALVRHGVNESDITISVLLARSKSRWLRKRLLSATNSPPSSLWAP